MIRILVLPGSRKIILSFVQKGINTEIFFEKVYLLNIFQNYYFRQIVKVYFCGNKKSIFEHLKPLG